MKHVFAVAAFALLATSAGAQVNPATATNAMTLGNTLGTSAAGMISTSTASTSVPGYSTTNPNQAYFGGGVGNIITPGTAAVSNCTTSTTATCQGINFLSNNATSPPVGFTINPTTNPTITTGNGVIATPTGGLGTGFSGTFLNQQTVSTCTSGTTPSPPNYATYQCTEQHLLASQACQPFQNVVVVPTYHYTCTQSPSVMQSYSCNNTLAVTVTQTVACAINSVNTTPLGYSTYNASCNAANLAVLNINFLKDDSGCGNGCYSGQNLNANFSPISVTLQPGTPQSGYGSYERNYNWQVQWLYINWSYDGAQTVTIIEDKNYRAYTFGGTINEYAPLGDIMLPALVNPGETPVNGPIQAYPAPPTNDDTPYAGAPITAFNGGTETCHSMYGGVVPTSYCPPTGPYLYYYPTYTSQSITCGGPGPYSGLVYVTGTSSTGTDVGVGVMSGTTYPSHGGTSLGLCSGSLSISPDGKTFTCSGPFNFPNATWPAPGILTPGAPTTTTSMSALAGVMCVRPTQAGVRYTINGGTYIQYSTSDTWNNGCAAY